MKNWIATRDEGERLLAAFTPRMGQHYASGRNTDHGTGCHTAVSVLSPYIKRRMVLEKDVVSAALVQHGPKDAANFIQEVLWRGYFKGWLEQRPQVWESYVQGLNSDLKGLRHDTSLSEKVDCAIEGRTGIACFDAWAEELVEAGYLHNHARMWFASIWIFTLDLPWRIGADFFLRHLIDGDAASNTLGWRWVAGLHTRGKFYAADAGNISTFTAGRFAPEPAELAKVTQGLEASEPEGLPPLLPLRCPTSPDADQRTALLITEEDCRITDFNLSAFDIRACATLSASHLRSPLPVAESVIQFERDALADAAKRICMTPQLLRADSVDILANWAAEAGVTQIATAYVTQGPLHDWLDRAASDLSRRGITLCEWQRNWDKTIWPHATAGFFKIKRQLPDLLEQILR